MSSDTQADGQTGRVALTQGLTMAHNFYSTNFTNLRVISLGRKHGSEWGMGTWSSMERDGKISTRKKSVSAKPGRVAHASGQCFYWVPECLREASCQQVPRGDWTSHQKYDKNQDGFVYSPGTVFMSTRTPCSLTCHPSTIKSQRTSLMLTGTFKFSPQKKYQYFPVLMFSEVVILLALSLLASIICKSNR